MDNSDLRKISGILGTIAGILGTIALIIQIASSFSNKTREVNYTPPPIETSANPPMTEEEKRQADERRKAFAEAKKLFDDMNKPPGVTPASSTRAPR
jgi:hypothetical protein